MEKFEINTTQETKSEIIIQESITNKLEEFFEEKKKYFLITNSTVAKLYPHILYKFKQENVIIIKDGEKYKNIKTFEKIINKLLSLKIERKDCIVALGGGVIGDLAGFCASSVLRGVNLIQIPTTLLAMCDSSIGGKTGFNSKFGKNLIGSFYKANKVLIDSQFLNTLNEYEYKCGLGEIVKYAFIEKSCKNEKNYNLIDFLLNKNIIEIKNEISYLINASVSLKTGVVSQDEREGNLRKILNFGHTFAHPIETLNNYKTISHGQAVAQGILIAFKLAKNLQKINKEYYNLACELINKLELDKKETTYNKKKFIQLMLHDKKVEQRKINLVLPVANSEVELFDNIALPSIEASLP